MQSAAAAVKLLQSCPTLCDPRDGSPPDSPVPGILQARTLEWVAIPSPVWYIVNQKMVGEDEMVGWYHQLNGGEFEQTLRDSEG